MLTSLRIKNFKNFRDEEHLIIFRPEEDICALSILVGKNGAGKSSTFDAIEWAIFQRSPKSLRAMKQDDLISDGEEFVSVKATFELKDRSVSLDITRELRKGKQPSSSGILVTTNGNSSVATNQKLNGAREIATTLREHFNIDLTNLERILIKQQCISTLSCAKPKSLLSLLESFIGTDKISAAANECFTNRDCISLERKRVLISGDEFLKQIKQMQPGVDNAIAVQNQKYKMNVSLLKLRTAEFKKLMIVKVRQEAKLLEVKLNQNSLSNSITSSLKSIDIISTQLKTLNLEKIKATRTINRCVDAIEKNELELDEIVAARRKAVQKSLLNDKKMKALLKLVRGYAK